MKLRAYPTTLALLASALAVTSVHAQERTPGFNSKIPRRS
jgi:hypothetical protein